MQVVTDSHHQVVEADAGADAPPEDLSLPPSEGASQVIVRVPQSGKCFRLVASCLPGSL